MKQLIFAIFILICASCTAQKEKKVASVKNENYLIMFDFSNIDDAHYSIDDSNFWLEYDDPDAFDLDHLAETTGRNEWYGDYIAIDIQDSLVSLFLIEWGEYNDLRNYIHENLTSENRCRFEWQRMDQLSESWGIQEIWTTFDDGSKDVRYELTYVGKEYNWYE